VRVEVGAGRLARPRGADHGGKFKADCDEAAEVAVAAAPPAAAPRVAPRPGHAS